MKSMISLLALASAAALRLRVTAGAAFLIGFTVWAGVLGAADPQLVHRDRDGTAPLWRVASGAEEWTRILPGYVLADADHRRLAVVWAVALAACVIGRKRPTPVSMAFASAASAARAAPASKPPRQPC